MLKGSRAKPNENNFFQAALLGFIDFEHEVIRAVGGQLTFCPEPNGNQDLSAGVLFNRFAGAHGLKQDERAYHVGLFLLFIGMMSQEVVIEYSYA